MSISNTPKQRSTISTLVLFLLFLLRVIDYYFQGLGFVQTTAYLLRDAALLLLLIIIALVPVFCVLWLLRYCKENMPTNEPPCPAQGRYRQPPHPIHTKIRGRSPLAHCHPFCTSRNSRTLLATRGNLVSSADKVTADVFTMNCLPYPRLVKSITFTDS